MRGLVGPLLAVPVCQEVSRKVGTRVPTFRHRAGRRLRPEELAEALRLRHVNHLTRLAELVK